MTGQQLSEIRALFVRKGYFGVFVNADVCRCGVISSSWFRGGPHEHRCGSCRGLVINQYGLDQKEHCEGVRHLYGETWDPARVWSDVPSWLWRTKEVSWWP